MSEQILSVFYAGLILKTKFLRVFAISGNLKKILSAYSSLQYRKFDFEDISSFNQAFEGIDILFLLRPPQIADVDKVFRPLIERALENGIHKVVFLSVQGADKTDYIPHAKIEKIILEKDMEYIFLRPSYFMQNLTTTLLEDLKIGKILLPAGNAKFNWIDVSNIGEFTAKLILDFEKYKNQSFDLTGSENFSFPEAVAVINHTLGTDLKYESPNLIRFYHYKRKQGVPKAMILVMIMLHFQPRFQKPPRISDNYQRIMKKNTTTLSEFAVREIENALNKHNDG